MAVTGPILSSALANDGVKLSFRIIIVISTPEDTILVISCTCCNLKIMLHFSQ